jgi:hypothetical protein
MPSRRRRAWPLPSPPPPPPPPSPPRVAAASTASFGLRPSPLGVLGALALARSLFRRRVPPHNLIRLHEVREER